MIADLSVRPIPAADPGAGVRPTPERTTISAAAGTQSPAVPSVSPRSDENTEDGVSVERLRSMLTDADLRVRTQHDPESGRTVMRFEDRVTGEMVEQFPSEELLKLYASIREPFIDQEV